MSVNITVHVTQETSNRTLITDRKVSKVVVQTISGYGLELDLFGSAAPGARPFVTHHDLSTAYSVSHQGPNMEALGYSIRRNSGVLLPFHVVITYEEAESPEA